MARSGVTTLICGANNIEAIRTMGELIGNWKSSRSEGNVRVNHSHVTGSLYHSSPQSLCACSSRELARDRFTMSSIVSKDRSMIPARDGVRLHTLIYAPKNAPRGPAYIMLRKPYGIDGRAAGTFAIYFKERVDEGYICVFMTIGGAFNQRPFVMRGRFAIRAIRRIDESDPTLTTRSPGC